MFILMVSDKQAENLNRATEVLARLGAGQFREALRHLPISGETRYDQWCDTMDKVETLLAPLTISTVDGKMPLLGVNSPDLREDSKIAWDLYQVIRNGLAWDKAVRSGEVASLHDRRTPKMWTVDYDAPLKTAKEPLASIVKTENPHSNPSSIDAASIREWNLAACVVALKREIARKEEEWRTT